MMPPPTPKREEKTPATRPIATSRGQAGVAGTVDMLEASGRVRRILAGMADALLDELVSAPRASAILLDVDGVLAPIVEDPRAARVPETTRAELTRLTGRYGLVACVTGRPHDDAARVVGVPGIEIVGEHGLELVAEAAEWIERLADFAAGVDWPAERKRLTLSFHFRRAGDEAAARAYLDRVAAWARESGLVTRYGRKVLEVRPPLAADKGTAVRALLERAGLDRALYAGDDTTDLDAFAALAGLELGIRIAVDSAEAPAGLREAADLVVDGPAGMLRLLRQL